MRPRRARRAVDSSAATTAGGSADHLPGSASVRRSCPRVPEAHRPGRRDRGRRARSPVARAAIPAARGPRGPASSMSMSSRSRTTASWASACRAVSSCRTVPSKPHRHEHGRAAPQDGERVIGRGGDDRAASASASGAWRSRRATTGRHAAQHDQRRDRERVKLGSQIGPTSGATRRSRGHERERAHAVGWTRPARGVEECRGAAAEARGGAQRPGGLVVAAIEGFGDEASWMIGKTCSTR